jgi:hypothetical protein
MALKQLNAEHYTAISLLSLPKSQRPLIKDIAAECGVTEQSIYNWKKDPLFERELKRQIVRNTIDRLPDVFDKVPDIIIEQGNAAMFKTLLQAHDMLTDKVEVETKTSGAVPDVEEMKRLLAEDCEE